VTSSDASVASRIRGACRDAFELALNESAIRLSLIFPGSPWRDPERYAHPLVGDDFWLLSGRWNTYGKKVARERIHPRLGWTQGPLTRDNPHGLVSWSTKRLQRDGRRKALFYGDSYVGGGAREENWVPQLLEERLAGIDVVHLGVGGYGPDQMHLLFRETLPLVDRPHLVLMGVMSYSFDRVAQGIRSYQKPLLEVNPDGALEVTNVPISRRPWWFYATRRPSFRSYWKAAKRLTSHPPERDDFAFESKVPLNRAIIAANRRLAEQAGARLMYVLFRDFDQLHRPGRRDRFFREELAAQGVDAFDTADALLGHAQRNGTDGSELYVDGHHNDLGNQVIAHALAEALERQGTARATR
jgi:hypothetical protein